MRWIISDLSVLDDFEFKGRAEIFIIFYKKSGDLIWDFKRIKDTDQVI